MDYLSIPYWHTYRRILVVEVKKLITKHMTITEVVEQYPKSIEVFLKHGMHCFG